MRKPSPAMIVALIALFVALGGVGVAATGGNFILGQSNTADQTTSLSGSVASGAQFHVVNTDVGAGVRGDSVFGRGIVGQHTGSTGSLPGIEARTASTDPDSVGLAAANTGGGSAMSLKVNPGVPPMAVNSAGKVANLNADWLDGLDAGSFMMGGGHSYTTHLESVPADGVQKTLLTVPSFGTLNYQCFQHPSFYWDAPFSVWELFEVNGLPPEGTAGGRGWSDLGYAVQIDILASRNDARRLGVKGVADIHFGGYWNYASNTCNFEAVALVWATGVLIG